MFNFRDQLVDKHICHLHPVDAGNALFFYCTVWTIISASFHRLFENERPDANLFIKMTIGITVPSRPSDSTHEHNFHRVTLTFARSVWWCLTRNEVEVRIDLCHVEPLFVDIYIVIHFVRMLFLRIHEGICVL